jgi:uncharacterized repeat protein (TIGR03803 family)
VLQSFNGTDGANPYASLIDVKGTLYGTTFYGGSGSFCGSHPCGTVFSVTTAGVGEVLYSFCSQPQCKDGQAPAAGVINVEGTLYGTTYEGGSYCESQHTSGCGTVFAGDRGTGKEKVIHSFCPGGYQRACTDGGGPEAGLIDINGTLYGTAGGGAYNGGVVFALSKP